MKLEYLSNEREARSFLFAARVVSFVIPSTFDIRASSLYRIVFLRGSH